MTAETLRIKLYEYIRVADKKKLMGIYKMLDNDVTESLEWWNDKAYSEELDERYNAWDKEKEKEFTQAELDAEIERHRSKRL